MKRDSDEAAGACRVLRAVLMEDLALGKRMLENSRAQQAALVANDHRQVASLEAAGQDLSAQQEANSLRREAAIRDAAAACAIQVQEAGTLPRLTELAGRLPATEARALLALRTRILETAKTLREVNDRNRVLVQNALDVVQFMFQTVADLARKPAGYGAAPGTAVAPPFYLDHRA